MAPTVASWDPGAQARYAVPPQWGASPKNRHDNVFLMEWHCIIPIGSLIELSAPGEGP
jgi:hypothetical protein